jgi:hypothetical protein
LVARLVTARQQHSCQPPVSQLLLLRLLPLMQQLKLLLLPLKLPLVKQNPA